MRPGERRSGVKAPVAWPRRGLVGLALVAVFWTLNWSLEGLRTHWGFFPLWLGYCLTIDAWTWRRTGTSLWARSAPRYVALFIVSAPAWWLFEAINTRTGNWVYEGRNDFGNVEYFLWASLSFSTVMPAVFGTSEWVGSFHWVQKIPAMRRWRMSCGLRAWSVVAGFAMLALTLLWPLYFFPLAWLSLFFLVDPLNDTLGRRSILQAVARGDWREPVALSLGALICGFFWEMWNFFSYPKWVYSVPFVDFFHVFEMPILGYGGYAPFSLELFALYHLMAGFAWDRSSCYVRVVGSTEPPRP